MKSKADEGLKERSDLLESGDSRRKALKKMLAGTGMAVGAAALPGKWVQPVVDKVLVPAHAQTSTTTTTEEPVYEYFSTYQWEEAKLDIDDGSPNKWHAKALNLIIPDAHANGEPGPRPSAMCAVVDGETADVTFRNRRNEYEFNGEISINGGEGLLTRSGSSCDDSDTTSVSIENRENVGAEVIGYTLGNPSIDILLTSYGCGGGTDKRTVTIDKGTCKFAPLDPCDPV